MLLSMLELAISIYQDEASVDREARRRSVSFQTMSA